MFDQATCADTRSATSLPASADGALRCAWLGGQTIDLFGPVPVLANLSARQAKELGLLMSGTCGPRSSTLSASVALQQSLASKLQAATALTGSTLYALTWKVRPTPLGRPICALRASVRRTSANDSTGWLTPTAALADKGVRTFEGGLLEAMRNHGPDLAAAACLTGWPTATATDAHRGQKYDPFAPNTTMNMAAQLCGWPTPTAGTPQSMRGNGQDPEVRKAQGHQVNLKDAVRYLLHDQPTRYTASGQVLTGSDAGMGSSGQLNPEHSRWLMGYPPAWQRCVVTAMQSFPKSRRRS
ncbi:hypothetical protein FHR47_002279 [Xanthomonas arboricola]|nr:hypothetical protein [Xanthomonas cannabis]MBB3802031.1 hypothetical protein [Xanthomonas cannabis]